jgi:hypothetical protein
MTRAGLSLLHGDWRAALHFNPFIFVIVPFVVIACFKRSAALNYLFLAMLAAFSVYRNLAGVTL